SGTRIDWSPLLPGGRRVALPTYPFQHQRYWLEETGGVRQGWGLETPVVLADGAGVVLSGRVSLATHAWLSGHVVHGRVVVPGSAFVDLVLRAGDGVGCDRIAELSVEKPLVVPNEGGLRLQVRVHEADGSGRRRVTVSTQPDTDDATTAWTRHAIAVIAADSDSGDQPKSSNEGEVRHVDVVLPPEALGAQAASFLLHPALLEEAWAAVAAGAELGAVIWRDVRLEAGGAERLDVRLLPTGEPDSYAVRAVDPDGVTVLTAGSVTLRPVTPQDAPQSLYRVEWRRLTAEPAPAPDSLTGPDNPVPWSAVAELPGGTDVPGSVYLVCTPPSGEPLADVRATVHEVLDVLQAWLADERLVASSLVVVTRGAVVVDGDDPGDLDPAQAAVWGMVRSAQAERPGRFVLLDVDRAALVPALVTAALRLPGEPQLAVRADEFHVPRLAPATAPAAQPPSSALNRFDPDGTVLLTGATGGLGRLLARHLVRVHEVRHLLLASRSGPGAARADELRAELTELGAEVDFAACDVGDPEALAELLGRVPDRHPLTAVVHVAGINDDALISTMTHQQVERVLRAKADAAVHLHRLTERLGDNLSAFVLFSSASGVFGGPGQANYAAANAFLDALAERRRAAGLSAVSLAWGLWDEADGMGGRITAVDRRRMARAGMGALSGTAGLALFDSALRADAAVLVPAGLDLAPLRAAGDPATVPPLLRGMVRFAPVRAVAAAAGRPEQSEGGLVGRLAQAEPLERRRLLVELVRTHVAAVLGHTGGAAVDVGKGFLELGLDSLTAVELRDRLGAETGLALPTTLVFDHPTVTDVAVHLERTLVPESGARPLMAELDRLEAGLGTANVDADTGREVAARLEALLSRFRPAFADPVGTGSAGATLDLESASLDEVLDFIDDEFGSA
ncbi:SDR family NAD(P)-dependent oxidoreductase, partial [Streptomyces sp. NPDC007851]|uniref:type I polyketide synthase n=1 Tax=Streptomyces sp. NPDC007851 TaxID=3155008 RepID=UPI0033FF187A